LESYRLAASKIQNLSPLLIKGQGPPPRNPETLPVLSYFLQEKGEKWGCKVVIPHERKSELDVVVFLPDELLTSNQEEAKELGSLAALHRVAGVPLSAASCHGITEACFSLQSCSLMPCAPFSVAP
jgi:hypothetical protein